METRRAYRLPKKLRLGGHTRTERVFAIGVSLKMWPFKVVYTQQLIAGKQPLPQMLFSIPKRQFKRAVDRNRLRRQCKDIYRRHVGNALLEAVGASGKDLHVAFIYTGGKTKLSALELEAKLSATLFRLAGIIRPKSVPTLSPEA
jgi:ribonuclease P protein component